MHSDPLPKACSAFSSTNPIHNPNLMHYSKTGSMLRPHPAKSHVRLNVSSSVPPPNQSFFSAQDIERELKGALEFARDMDKKYGLCTEPSKHAWALVDELYQTIEALQVQESDDHSSSNLSETQNTRENARKTVLSRSYSLPNERELNGTKYFF